MDININIIIIILLLLIFKNLRDIFIQIGKSFIYILIISLVIYYLKPDIVDDIMNFIQKPAKYITDIYEQRKYMYHHPTIQQQIPTQQQMPSPNQTSMPTPNQTSMPTPNMIQQPENQIQSTEQVEPIQTTGVNDMMSRDTYYSRNFSNSPLMNTRRTIS